MKALLGNSSYEIVTAHRFDTGGMFDGTAGIVQDGRYYRAYVKDGWGGGIIGRKFCCQEEAEKDIPRLKEKFYG